MKRIIYSSVLKFLAVVLFCACITLGVLTVGHGIVDFYDETPNVYSFERDFSESWYMASLLQAPEDQLYNVFSSYYTGYDSYGNPYSGERADLDVYLYRELNDIYCSDKIDYYIQWNDLTFSNCDTKEWAKLREKEFYSYLKRDGKGNVERDSSLPIDMAYGSIFEEVERFDKTSHIVVACSVKDEVVEEYRALWEKQEGILVNTFFMTLGFAILALLFLVYLLSVCGKNAQGEYQNMWLDHIFLEFHLAWMVGLGLGGGFLCVILVDEYQADFFHMRMLDPALGSISALGSLGILTSLLSIVRNLKTRRLVETSFLLRILRWIGRGIKAFWKAMIRLLSKKTGILLLAMLFFYTALVGLLGIGTVISPLWLCLGVLLFGVAAFMVACRARDLDEIKKGVERVRGGNLAYKIPQLLCEDMKGLAVNVNTIAQGLEESVAAQVKAERMKSELITNVSHDLKTPITSVISYTKLLSQVENLPEEARDYVAVIAKKSDRLKKLTQDLFDISKAQSGNDEVELEKLNLVLLLQQALGEHDSDVQSSGLTFCVKAPKEAYISADGRKMSRVLGNLIENILKYTMKNTRVFLTITEKEGEVVLECKNISAYPLDFDVEEITQRFVRGDEARSTEGNGLGLAIAKSYTEICGGKFGVVIDGDMFKAILRFGSCN